jgi:hypothetical protein
MLQTVFLPVDTSKITIGFILSQAGHDESLVQFGSASFWQNQEQFSS